MQAKTGWNRLFAAVGIGVVALLLSLHYATKPQAGSELPSEPISSYQLPNQAIPAEINNELSKETKIPGFLGLKIGFENHLLRVQEVESRSPADHAGIQIEDIIISVNQRSFSSMDAFREWFHRCENTEKLEMVLDRRGKRIQKSVQLIPLSKPLAESTSVSWDSRSARLFLKKRYQLGIIPIQFPDMAMNPKNTDKDWEQTFLTQAVKTMEVEQSGGSLHDYYHEVSAGNLSIEGKVFLPITARKNRLVYATTTSRNELLTEVLDQLRNREGKQNLNNIDGFFFIYAGSLAAKQRSSFYWPHSGSFRYQGESIRYAIFPEGTDRQVTLNTAIHEFGHLLGLPDLYAKPEIPDSESVGPWCAMAQHNRTGRPQHFCAWSKEQLHWIKPTMIDPAVSQKLILFPIEGTFDQCFKIPLDPKGSEYILLENRSRKGFDRDLPGEGLLIWHVVDGRPKLIESHGVTNRTIAAKFLSSVPYPSAANHSWTPYTTPGSKKVFITQITRWTDGRITFQIGSEFF